MGEHLRKARIERNIQQQKLAELLGTNSVNLSCWELNKKSPHPKYIKAIIDFLGYVPEATSSFEQLGSRLLIFLENYNISLKKFSETFEIPFIKVKGLVNDIDSKIETELIISVEKILNETKL